MQGQILIISTILIIVIVIVVVTLQLIRKKRINKYMTRVRELERDANLIASTPVLLELSKVETVVNNDRMEEKYSKWQNKFENLKEKKLSEVNNMIIELENIIENKDYKNFEKEYAKTELELYKCKEIAENLLEQIKDITSSEEKYRSIITKLKTKYRKFNKEFENHRSLYEGMQEAIELQLENIEKRFLDFEQVMENNEYDEVVHIVKALDTMVDHMDIIINETPDNLLMANELIPKRIKEIEETVKQMTKEGYPLEYLNIDYNIEEAKKNIETIMDKIKMLNLEGCMFDLKTILDYLDSLFVDFEKERLSRKVYEEINKDFSKKLRKINKTVKEIYNQLDDIKNMYDLKQEDVKIIDDANKDLVEINDDYKNLKSRVKEKTSPYSVVHKEIEDLTVRLKNMEEHLDISLKSLGNMYDDEVRAREQLDEIQEFLKQCKIKIRSYKLPVITKNYFVELSEANEAILEVIKELEKKPIVIKTLNTRVDTARDLVLKLYKTTNEMVKTAMMAEQAIVYGNRYISNYEEVEKGISKATKAFYKGNYKEALDISIKATSIVDEDIYQKLLAVYDE